MKKTCTETKTGSGTNTIRQIKGLQKGLFIELLT
ncbi:MAG: hypothetical protein JWQ66_1834 [Mucilaginibacter sp.]|nr:hypothetical protein [Mucilaginibacter sp.]